MPIVEYLGKIFLVETFKVSINKLIKEIKVVGMSQEKKDRLTDALTSIQFASINTRNFIDDKGYEPNMDLAIYGTML